VVPIIDSVGVSARNQLAVCVDEVVGSPDLGGISQIKFPQFRADAKYR
jgi:hypothetical protein